MSLASLRRDYARATLDEREIDPDPLRQFQAWFDDALRAGVPEPNAMTLATANSGGAPSARIVLLKGVDARGFVFFTDYRSRKAAELAVSPYCALVFFWVELERQVRVSGSASAITAEESAAYFRTRPRGSRLAAWASHQSQSLADRATLEEQLANVTHRFAGIEPPLPPHWGGYRVAPTEIEFWQGRPDRLHDRVRYLIREGEWRVERLSP